MDCRTARLLLDFARPLATELEESDGEALATHLAECPTCGALRRTERRLDDHLGRAMLAVLVPDGLRERVLGKLAAQRDSWYRRRLLIWGTGAAAAAAIVVGLSLTFLAHKPVLDMVTARAIANRPLPDRSEEVGAWFGDAGLEGPPQFEYARLTNCEWASFQDHRLPMLEFRKGNEWARVYIVTEGQFDLKALKATQPDASGRAVMIDVLEHPTKPGVAYIVKYTGGVLPAFFYRDTGPAT
ncbi:MAG: DUF3379 family protein [Gemmataceae bacterium]|nr:DUF3379 family protein [Gemmataceae bacterium]